MSFIEFKDVSLRFGENQVLKNFNLLVNKGDKVLISGKSGKGKSTLLRLLLGFETCDSGEILLESKSLTSYKPFDSRKLFAYVNQDVTIRQGKTKEVLLKIAEFSGNDFSGELDKALCDYFEFGNELLEKDTQSLSGGERQRLGVLLAIMLDRPIFLLDEITSALDKELKGKVVDYFSKVDKTVIAISHDHLWSENDVFSEVAW